VVDPLIILGPVQSGLPLYPISFWTAWEVLEAPGVGFRDYFRIADNTLSGRMVYRLHGLGYPR
jgi:hypothetical protein